MRIFSSLAVAALIATQFLTAAAQTTRGAFNSIRVTPPLSANLNTPAPLVPHIISAATLAAPSLPAGLKNTEGSPIAVILDVKAPVGKKAFALNKMFDQFAPSSPEAVEIPGRTDAPPAASLNPATIAPAEIKPTLDQIDHSHGGTVHHHDLIKKEVAGASFALIGMGAAIAPFAPAILLALTAVIPSMYLAGGVLGAFIGNKFGAPKAGAIVGRVIGSIAGAVGTYALLVLAPELVVAHTLLVLGALSGSLLYEYGVKKYLAKRTASAKAP